MFALTQLNPGESFPILFQNPDPIDATVYFPQAVIQNASDLTLVTKVNLANKGSGLYGGILQVPQDSSGNGLYISITITVFTDAGHTAKANNQGVLNVLYLVQFRPNSANSSGGDGDDTDYKKIKKIVEEALQGHKPNIKFPTQQKFPDVQRFIERSAEKITESFLHYLKGHSSQVGSMLDKHHSSILNGVMGHTNQLSKSIAENALILQGHKEELQTLLGTHHESLSSLLFNNSKELIGKWDEDTKKSFLDFQGSLISMINERMDNVPLMKYEFTKPRIKDNKKPSDVMDIAKRLVQ